MSNQKPPLAPKLPPKPDLRHLKNQAKDLLRNGAAGTLAGALFEIARRYGFSSWPRLKEHIASLTDAGELKEAINQNDLEAVRRLFHRNPALRNAPIGYGGDGPLTWAAECRGAQTPPAPERLELAKWLLDDGADIHQGGDAPLTRAALFGSRAPMMQLLFDRGADVNAAWHGNSPILFGPCETVNADSLVWLLRHGADPNCGEESKWKALGKKHPGTALDYLLGTYVRDTSALNACIDVLLRAGGRSRYLIPEVIAAITGDKATLRGLIQTDKSLLKKRYPSLDIGTTGERMLTLRGSTLLHVAAEFGHREVAEFLLDSGADVNAAATVDSAGVGGQTAIFHAAAQGRDFGLEVVKLLIERGADLEVRCRLPGHYEEPGQIFEGTVLEYATRFPGKQAQTLAELSQHEPG
jgi:ankyrin repeat protein